MSIITEPYENHRQALLAKNGITLEDVAVEIRLLLCRRHIKTTHLVNNDAFLAEYKLPDHNPATQDLRLLVINDTLILQAGRDVEGAVVLAKGNQAFDFLVEWANPLMEDFWCESILKSRGVWPTIAQLTNISKDILAAECGIRDKVMDTVSEIISTDTPTSGFIIDGNFTVKLGSSQGSDHLLFDSEAGQGLSLLETVRSIKTLVMNKKDIEKWLEETL